LPAALALAGIVVAAGCGGGGGRGGAGEAGSSRPSTTAPASTTTAPPAPTTAAPPPPATARPSTTTAPPRPVDVNALRPPRPAADPAGLAAQIERAETTLRSPGAGEAAVAAAALAQQVAYRRLGDHPDWDRAVLAALPPGLAATARRHVAARRELRALARRPADTMPAWRIVPPAPADQLVRWYRAAEAEFGVPWQHLAAVNLVETGLGRIRGTSVAGAQGPMQFLPSTWAAYGEGDIDDPRQAIRAAARYLRANGAPGNMAGALWNYNHSDHYVRAVQLYAGLIAERPDAFAGFYHWGVWYWTTAGDLFLPVGYAATAKVPVEQYISAAPR
jgi:membrane-bound lytic murein transglycosylase B